MMTSIKKSIRKAKEEARKKVCTQHDCTKMCYDPSQPFCEDHMFVTLSSSMTDEYEGIDRYSESRIFAAETDPRDWVKSWRTHLEKNKKFRDTEHSRYCLDKISEYGNILYEVKRSGIYSLDTDYSKLCVSEICKCLYAKERLFTEKDFENLSTDDKIALAGFCSILCARKPVRCITSLDDFRTSSETELFDVMRRMSFNDILFVRGTLRWTNSEDATFKRVTKYLDKVQRLHELLASYSVRFQSRLFNTKITDFNI